MRFDDVIGLWREGQRRLAQADPRDRPALERVIDALVDELRRRLGGPFTTDELARYYGEQRNRLVLRHRDAGRARQPGGVGPDDGRGRGVRALRARGQRLRRRRAASSSTDASAAPQSTIVVRRRLRRRRRRPGGSRSDPPRSPPRRAGGRPSTRRRSGRPARRDRATARSPPRRGRTSPRAASALRRVLPAARRRRATPAFGPSLLGFVLVFLFRRLPRPRLPRLAQPRPQARRRSARRPRRGDRSRRRSRRPRRRSGSPLGSSPCSRLNAWICWTVTSSWWAIHASVRPCRTQARIRFSSGRSDRRAIFGAETSTAGGWTAARSVRIPDDRSRVLHNLRQRL